MTKTTGEAALCLRETALGIEFGSTQIKAVLIDRQFRPVALGSFGWKSRFENGYWTYPLDEVRAGLQACFARLRDDVREKYGIPLDTVGCIGVSGMMHGYLAFDRDDNLLTPFRTWQNTSSGEAAARLTELFHFNIPQRWSVAHLYQAMLNREPHVGQICRLDTLASYIHRSLTGCRAIGVGEASGMFPISAETGGYDETMLRAFAPLAKDYPWTLEDLLPPPLPAGAPAGALTEAGARLLDPSGTLRPGIPFCPPEGDAGTGMTATNAVAPRTGNVSAGTSIFSMVVLEHALKEVHPEIDLVTTPSGKPVAMIHCNNCTSDMNAWVALFREVIALSGGSMEPDDLYPALYRLSLSGAPDCGGVSVCNYLSGEHTTGFEAGAPLCVRDPAKPLSLADFVRAHLYSALATLSLGMEILRREEVAVDRLVAHGGLFKTPGVGQRYLAAAVETPVWVMETAGMGGPYGMALLAAYRTARESGDRQTLERFLETCVFADAKSTVLEPAPADRDGFRAYLRRFERLLTVERAALNFFNRQ